jgi:CRP-like cAMP-binding protein
MEPGGIENVSASMLSSVVNKSEGILLHLHGHCFRAGDLSEHAFYILMGAMTITDTKEASRNPVIKRVQCDQWFGDEEAMSSVKRALTAAACENPTIVLKVPTEEFEACMVGKCLGILGVLLFGGSIEAFILSFCM